MFTRIIALLGLLTVVSPVRAEEQAKSFYSKPIDGVWHVGGNQYVERNSGCFAHAEFKDGSSAEIVRDLVDSELWMRIQNVEWNLQSGVDDKMRLRMNLQRDSKVIDGSAFDWKLIDKNTIVINQIELKPFMDTFWKSNIIRIIMPGNTSNIIIPAANSRAIINALAECIKQFAPLDKPPSLESTPKTGATSKPVKGAI